MNAINENQTNEIEELTQPADAIADESTRDDAVLAEANRLGIDLGKGEDFDPLKKNIKDEKPPTKEELEEQLIKEMQTEEGSMYMATNIVTGLEGAFKLFGHKSFTIADLEKAESAKAIAPAIQKYSGSLVPFMGNYEVEIKAAFALGMLAYGSVSQIKALKALDREKLVNPTESPEPEQSSATEPTNTAQTVNTAEQAA
ncbi:hypothetical protein J8L73_14995 [Pseudoalteromonas sp. MMG006]|uniref:hypothetical protein n=1 Tax=Pseudoalteromonas sp. MMG006 TaxID=2822683 RepID=UPI001B394848|nr:hypothetical protein [Pseudoalteromonas sp. MMG006]MBQ4800425.1 hypothetical protein [Pseudoalteromonas sp. MMG006]